MRAVCLDSAFRNVGVCIGELNDDVFTPHSLFIIKTKNRKVKSKTIADYEDCQYLVSELHKITKDANIIVFEIPAGSQSSRASKAFGYIVGVVAGLKDAKPVTQSQVKKATGNPKASKDDMINWARTNYPDLNWDDFNRGDWQHLADACGCGVAFVKFYKISQV